MVLQKNRWKLSDIRMYYFLCVIFLVPGERSDGFACYNYKINLQISNIMDTAIITWLSVLTLVCLFVLTKMFMALHQRHTVLQPVRSHSDHRHPGYHHIIERSNESEMLFVPGDTVDTRAFDNDCNADDNF